MDTNPNQAETIQAAADAAAPRQADPPAFRPIADQPPTLDDELAELTDRQPALGRFLSDVRAKLNI